MGLSEQFAETRESLHALAEHVLCAARYHAMGRIGLQVVEGGFATPPFGDDRPSDATLWPEHFDVGIRAGEVNYGASPGDAQVPEPYLYVGPTGLDLAATGDGFWNQPFGATMTWEAIGSVQDALDFFRQGHRHAAG